MNSLGQETKFCIMHEKSVTQLSRLRTYQNVVVIKANLIGHYLVEAAV